MRVVGCVLSDWALCAAASSHYDPNIIKRALVSLVAKHPDASGSMSPGDEPHNWFFEPGDMVGERVADVLDKEGLSDRLVRGAAPLRSARRRTGFLRNMPPSKTSPRRQEKSRQLERQGSIIARWLPPGFNNGLDPEGAINLTYALPNLHVEYVRVEPPGIPTAFWRSVGPSHNVFVTESFMDELAAAAKQDAIAYRLLLLDRSPRAQAVLQFAAEKAGWGQPLPESVGRGVSLQFVFGTYMAHVAEVEVSKVGAVRVGRVVCAVDCGTVVNPDTVLAQIQSAVVFGITAALHGEITLTNGRVEQTNFDNYQMLRINEAPVIEVHVVQNFEPLGGMGQAGTSAIVPAVTNAIFAATGRRLRKLPIDTAALTMQLFLRRPGGCGRPGSSAPPGRRPGAD